MKTDNELIAEFMGAEFVNDDLDNFPNGYYINHREMLPSWFDYDNSWDWLMPVVEKIRTLEYSNALYGGNWTDMIFDETCVICEFPQAYFGDKGKIVNRCSEIIACQSGNTMIEATYKAVVEFIKWYNQYK